MFPAKRNADLLAATVATRVGTPPNEQARTFRGLAGAVCCPVLVVHGERDEIVPPAWGRAVAQALVATFLAHPDAGHCPQLSYPAVVKPYCLTSSRRSPAPKGRGMISNSLRV